MITHCFTSHFALIFISHATLLLTLSAHLHAEQIEQPEQHDDKKPGISKFEEVGWPDNMKDVAVRFIRLEHSGRSWDDGMNKSGADANLLSALSEQAGSKAAKKGESHSISLLTKYEEGSYPPFLFLTGNGNLGRISRADSMTLRDYCLNHGMLIADAGSPRFHRSFLHQMRVVFPDKEFLEIASDDPIYQSPHAFPDGAPSFWHHGGRRALGIKHEGRWIVFYHPGDMNDAWKSESYSDITPEMREAALNLGVNLIYYAFKQTQAREKADPAKD